MFKVTLLDKVGRKGKVKIRLEDGPHPGLEEYVSTRQLVIAWGGRNAVVRDEARAAALAEHAARTADRALGRAASVVLEATGEPSAVADANGAKIAEAELRRILHRAGLSTEPVDLHLLAYRDRHGDVHLPLEAAVRVARAFAEAEPRTVTGLLDDEEEETRLRGNRPGDRWSHDRLRQDAPGFALARQWAGLEQEADILREEIARLRSLVSRAAAELRAAGAEEKSRRVLRALDGR